MASALTTEHVDYLQRVDDTPGRQPRDARWTQSPPALRRLARVRRVGRFDPEAPPPRDPEGEPVLPTADLLSGLHGYKIPLAFLIRATPGEVRLHLGTWAPSGDGQPSPGVLDGRQGLVGTALGSLYPTVELETVDAEGDLDGFPRAGLVVGTPVAKPVDDADPAAPLDRLVRAMGPADWAALVLAQPVDEAFAVQLRRSVINEIRAAETAEQAQLAPSPLGRHYSELLATMLDELTAGYAVGTWRTATALFGDEASYHRLATAWRAVFSGADGGPEPLRVAGIDGWDPQARTLVAAWGMDDEPAPEGPGRYRHPFARQTLLSSRQLAAYVHLPQHEIAGFAVDTVPRFDVVPAAVDGTAAVPMGRVVHLAKTTQTPWRVELDALRRHAFVAGVTGSGKTNTLIHLLTSVAEAGVPFLVVEPAKAEYRALLDHPALKGSLRVFTCGDERAAPLRLNPLEVPEGTPVGQHLDLLRSVFAAGFGMWTPLPQILERALHEVYADHGWDLTTGGNRRLADGDDRADAMPTLGDLVTKAEEIVPLLGYEQRVTDDLRAALSTRLDALRRGGKGRMLDVRRSVPVAELLSAPAVLELEPMGDDDDKAFLMALLLARLVEHRRTEGAAPGLRHVLVVEEAHRLLAAVPARGEEEADPRGKAVETFSALLAEIRAYGQGVIVADQVPTRLLPDVVKGTGLKIAHRVVAADDRQALAGAMAMDERQRDSLTVLPVGRAAVFGTGDDHPLLVQVPLAEVPGRPDDAEVAERMRAWRRTAGVEERFAVTPFCPTTCADEHTCEVARRLALQPGLHRPFDRMVLSTLDDPGALRRLWPDVVQAAVARRPAGVGRHALLRSLAGHLSERYARRRGAQEGWTYGQAARVGDLLRAAVLAGEEEDTARADAGGDAVAALRRHLRDLAVRDHDPYPFCSRVCDQAEPPLCLYRSAMADLVDSGRYRAAWNEADAGDATGGQGRRPQTWEVCQDAGYEAIQFPEEGWPEDLREQVTGAARRACLCFGQQMLAADARKVQRTVRRVGERLLGEAGV